MHVAVAEVPEVDDLELVLDRRARGCGRPARRRGREGRQRPRSPCRSAPWRLQRSPPCARPRAAAPDRARSPAAAVRRPTRVIAVQAASVSAPTAAASPSSSTISSASASPPMSPPPALRTASSAAASRNSSAAGTIPASLISATAAAARSMPVNVAASVDRDLGGGDQPQEHLGDHAERPLGADQQREQPRRRCVTTFAEPHDPPVGEDRRDAGDEIRRDAVAQRVRTCGVAGDVAPDRARRREPGSGG